MKTQIFILLVFMQLTVSSVFAQTASYAAQQTQTDKIIVGNFIPDITLHDINKNKISLNSFAGKYVLIQFWASWCKPSRVDNYILNNIYQKFKLETYKNGTGFEIYSISLDDSENNWRNAIIADKVSQWYHVSELEGVFSNVARQMNVTAIPTNILIDGERRIIATQFKITELQSILENNLLE